MNAWTHWVRCAEFKESHGKNYRVKAVRINGEWRLAERGFSTRRYGMRLTRVVVVEVRG